MKKIYVAHSTSFLFKDELYAPLKKMKNFQLILPHDQPENPQPSKEIIKTCSAVIAEVSTPSHGVGIELGWADSFGVPIVFIFKKNARLSSSLNIISQEFIEYESVEAILPALEKILFRIAR